MVVLTGAYAAWMEMGALLDVDTEYGRTLLMKAGLVAGALALGSLNYFDGGRMRPWLDGFRTRLSVEVMVAASVLLMTAVLATTPPIHAAGGVAIEPVPDAFGDVAPQMEMHVVPGRPGVNRVVVTTTDALASAAGMELGLDRLDTGTSTRVPLVLEGTHGMDRMEGMDHAGMVTADADGSVDWIADALILPRRERLEHQRPDPRPRWKRAVAPAIRLRAGVRWQSPKARSRTFSIRQRSSQSPWLWEARSASALAWAASSFRAARRSLHGWPWSEAASWPRSSAC